MTLSAVCGADLHLGRWTVADFISQHEPATAAIEADQSLDLRTSGWRKTVLEA